MMSAPQTKNYCSNVPFELFITIRISVGPPLKHPRRLDIPQGTDQTFLLKHTLQHTCMRTISYSIYRSVYNNIMCYCCILQQSLVRKFLHWHIITTILCIAKVGLSSHSYAITPSSIYCFNTFYFIFKIILALLLITLALQCVLCDVSVRVTAVLDESVTVIM